MREGAREERDLSVMIRLMREGRGKIYRKERGQAMEQGEESDLSGESEGKKEIICDDQTNERGQGTLLLPSR